ncbi:MAG: GAF domain-containing protein [Polyangia bacterium]
MSPSHVLLVAPADPKLEQLIQRLRSANVEVSVFSESIGIVNAVLRASPSLVVLDTERGMIDAVALCGLMQKNPKVCNVPVLLLGRFDEPREGYQKAAAAAAQGAIDSRMPPADLAVQILSYLGRKRPLLPANESQRVRALRTYEVLDTPQERVFDDLVRVASVVCQTPIALVSLVDETRQWFKARVGLAATQTPREQAFCAHAIHGRDLLEVPDATRDPRFASNPLVVGDPDIRFYAGAPLTNKSGLAAGTLCVIDRKPRQLTQEQREALLALGRIATTLLEQRALARGVTDEQKAMSRTGTR